MDKIKLHSRYDEENYLIKVSDNEYECKFAGCYRIGYFKDTKEIKFVDPSGGPLIQVGSVIEEIGKKVISIKNNIIIVE